MIELMNVGKLCKNYRINTLKLNQSDVAKETGYSIENISKFECGNNNNLKIFLWYLNRGFKL